MLNWYRSWPSEGDWAELEAKKHNFGYVVDNVPKIVMSGQNYKTVAEHNRPGWPDDRPGFCMLEWDVALDPIERMKFAGEALQHPYDILVANYRIQNSCVNRLIDGTPIDDMDGEEAIAGTSKATRCETFGLGCIYIPQRVLQEFLGQMDHLGFTDFTFSHWYLKRYGQARVTWNVHPQHLHAYEVE